MPTLSLRAINRATLDRQFLLRRHPRPAQQAVRQLAGMQAQAPLAPYVGLWARLSGFNPAEISTHLSERTVVRAPIMRGTVHLVDSADFVAFRPLFGALMAGALRANFTRTWKITKGALTISSFRSLTNEEKADITQEGTRLLAFTAPDSTAPGADADPPDIRFTAA